MLKGMQFSLSTKMVPPPSSGKGVISGLSRSMEVLVFQVAE
jgi:hypothetical protein